MKVFIFILLIGFFINPTFPQWQHLPCNGLTNSVVTNGNIIYAGNGNTGFWLSQDNGLTWTQKNNGLPITDVATIAILGQNLLAGTSLGLYKSQNNGDSWSSAGLYGLTITCMAIMDNKIFVGTYLSGIYISQDIGVNWLQVNNGLDTKEISSLLIVDSTVFAGTLLGVFKSQDYGGHWVHLDNGIPHIGVYSFLSSNSSLYAGTYYGGSLYKSEDFGTTWTVSNNGIPVNEVVYSFIDNNYGIFAGTGSGVYISKDSANNWSPKNNGLPTHPNVLSLAMNQIYLFAGTDTGVWRVPLSELGINKLNLISNPTVYPNPANSYIKIYIPNSYLNSSSIDFYNLQGIKIKHIKFFGINENTIFLNDFIKGIYLIKIQCGNFNYNSKLIVE